MYYKSYLGTVTEIDIYDGEEPDIEGSPTMVSERVGHYAHLIVF